MGRKRMTEPVAKYPKFAEKIKELMKENKMNQSELARQIPCTSGLVAHWVNGTRHPTLPWQQRRLLEIFNVTSDWLLFDKKPERIIVLREIIEELEKIKKTLEDILKKLKEEE